MRVFIDANVLVYAVSEGEFRQPCLSLLESIAAGERDGACSVAVLEELWHLELSGRMPGLDGQTKRACATFDSLLPVTQSTFDLALGLSVDDRLGANDRVHVATCMEHGIQGIVTADRIFESVDGLERLDPRDLDLG